MTQEEKRNICFIMRHETCWRCDMKKLYDMLKEMNLIKDY